MATGILLPVVVVANQNSKYLIVKYENIADEENQVIIIIVFIITIFIKRLMKMQVRR